MLEIQEKIGDQGYEELKERFAGQDLHITESMEGGRVTGYIAYFYGTDKTTVCGCDDGGDLMLCDGLVRSVMFKSVLKGIETMEFDLAGEAALENLRKLRFLTGDSRVCEGLSGYMNACEGCKNNK